MALEEEGVVIIVDIDLQPMNILIHFRLWLSKNQIIEKNLI